MNDKEKTITFSTQEINKNDNNKKNKKEKKPHDKSRKANIIKLICIVLAFICIIGNSGVAAIVVVSDSDSGTDTDILSQLDDLTLDQTSIVYTMNSSGDWVEYLRLHSTENRIWVSGEEIPDNLENAFIAIEDKRFKTHNGVDWKRTIAAFANSIFHFYSSNQGGSTITQQLVKNLTGDDSQTPARKIREIKRALKIERKYSKDTIMECYLNTIYFGNSLYGVETASNYYFGKSVSELSLSECASLAAIVKDPSSYKPDDNPENNTDRRDVVLYQMLDQGMITQDEYDEATNESVVVNEDHSNMYETDVYSYFIDTMIDELIDDISKYYGLADNVASLYLYNGGFKIYSSLDTSVQNEMESVYEDTSYFTQVGSDGSTPESAMTVMDYTGHIVGIVGGAGDKTVSRGLNRATTSPRQPGSSIKPLASYSLAVDKGLINYSSIVDDSAISNFYSDGSSGPSNWYGDYYGNVTVERALDVSINTVPCKLVKQLGVNTVYNFLKDKLNFGYLTDDDKNLSSLGIGGMVYGITTTESASAYAIFGNGGYYYSPTTYYEVKDSDDKTILEDSEGTQVISSETATVMNRLLQTVVTSSEGTANYMKDAIGVPVFAKTGTSNDTNDLWFVGGTPYYVASCWYGFDTPEAMTNGSQAKRIWRSIMYNVQQSLEYKDFTYDSDVVELTYCKESGDIAVSGCTDVGTGWYVPGTYKNCSVHSNDTTVSDTDEEETTEKADETETTSVTETKETETETETTSETKNEGETKETTETKDG